MLIEDVYMNTYDFQFWTFDQIISQITFLFKINEVLYINISVPFFSCEIIIWGMWVRQSGQ